MIRPSFFRKQIHKKQVYTGIIWNQKYNALSGRIIILNVKIYIKFEQNDIFLCNLP